MGYCTLRWGELCVSQDQTQAKACVEWMCTRSGRSYRGSDMNGGSGITGDHGGTETDGSEATSAVLVQVLMEQQRVAREQYQQAQEQQAAQQDVLIRLVEQQREEMARYREEMRSARAEAAAATRRSSLNQLSRNLAIGTILRTSSPRSRGSPSSRTGRMKCGLRSSQVS